jgi:hypothetical protein
VCQFIQCQETDLKNSDFYYLSINNNNPFSISAKKYLLFTDRFCLVYKSINGQTHQKKVTKMMRKKVKAEPPFSADPEATVSSNAAKRLFAVIRNIEEFEKDRSAEDIDEKPPPEEIYDSPQLGHIAQSRPTANPHSTRPLHIESVDSLNLNSENHQTVTQIMQYIDELDAEYYNVLLPKLKSRGISFLDIP